VKVIYRLNLELMDAMETSIIAILITKILSSKASIFITLNNPKQPN